MALSYLVIQSYLLLSSHPNPSLITYCSSYLYLSSYLCTTNYSGLRKLNRECEGGFDTCGDDVIIPKQEFNGSATLFLNTIKPTLLLDWYDHPYLLFMNYKYIYTIYYSIILALIQLSPFLLFLPLSLPLPLLPLLLLLLPIRDFVIVDGNENCFNSASGFTLNYPLFFFVAIALAIKQAIL